MDNRITKTLEKASDGGMLLGVPLRGRGAILISDLISARIGSLLPVYGETPGRLSTSQNVSMAKQHRLSKQP